MNLFKKIFKRSDRKDPNTKINKPDFEKLVSSDDLDDTIIEISTYISDLCAHGDEMGKLTVAQKKFYYNQCLEMEINNGGFNQYFFNSYGAQAHQTVQSLQKIGANKTAAILQKAIEQFPNSEVPEDRTERLEIMEQIEETANPVWDELDEQFYKYEDNLNLLNIEFIKKNMDQF